MVPEVNKPPDGVNTQMTVGYFVGCMTDFVFPELGKKIINFLTRNGVEVIVPRGQGCCGAPVFLGAGDFETGRKMADVNVKTFKDLDYVITDCATCASAMKDYTKFLADNNERKQAYGEFARQVERSTTESGKSQLITQAIKRQTGSFSLAEISVQCPHASIQLIKKVLYQLKKKGVVRLSGRGRGARWTLARGK